MYIWCACASPPCAAFQLAALVRLCLAFVVTMLLL